MKRLIIILIVLLFAITADAKSLKWDASTGDDPGDPTAPEKGDYWIVSVSGNTDLDGTTDWQIGDFARQRSYETCWR